MHTAELSCVSRFIARDVARIASAVLCNGDAPVFCIFVFFEKGIMKNTLHELLMVNLPRVTSRLISKLDREYSHAVNIGGVASKF